MVHTLFYGTRRFHIRRCSMSDLHLKDVRDDLTHEPPWVYLYAALFIGIVAFALLSAGFMG
jgi:hypothetical protein